MKERGSASVLAIAAIALSSLVALAVVAATQVVTARARAVAAADAAALAAAPMTFPPVAAGRSPVETAGSLAAVNGARLIRCQCSRLASLEPRQVTVEVEVPVKLVLIGHRWIRAVSSAEFVP